MEGTFQVETFDGQRASVAAKRQRESEIETWLSYCEEFFLNAFKIKISLQKDAAKYIGHHYWESMEEKVRPRIRSKNGEGPVVVDRHKICSLIEMVVMYVAPIEAPDPDELNARLAFFVAINIIGNWQADKIHTLSVGEDFDREHLALLRNINRSSDGWPIFSNAATWYLFEQLCIARYSAK